MTMQVKVHGYLAEIPKSDLSTFVASEVRYSPKRRSKNKYVREFVPLYREIAGKYYVGFGAIRYLMMHNPMQKFKIEVERAYPLLPLEYDPWPEGIEARWYQQEALDVLQFERGGIIELPTAAGKSIIETMVAIAAAKQGNVIICAPRIVILKSIMRNAAKCGVKVAWYEDYREKEIPESGMIFITNPTNINNDIKKAANWGVLRTIRTLILDEGHHLNSDTWYALQYGLPNVVRCFAFSATSVDQVRTPHSFRLMDYEDAMVYAGAGPILLRYRPVDIKEYLNRPTVIDVNFQWDDRYSKIFTSNKWKDILNTIVSYQRRIETIAEMGCIASSYGHLCTIPVSTTTYGDNLYDTINRMGGRCAKWYGGQKITSPEGEKLSEDVLIQRLVSGDIKNVVLTSHADEGLDIPSVSVSILTEGRRTRTQIQRAGRAARMGSLPSLVLNLFDQEQGVLRTQASNRSQALRDYYEMPGHSVRSMTELDGLIRSKFS